MAEYEDREHFIPLRKNDLIELLKEQPELPAAERDNFEKFCKLVIATYHFEYHDSLETIKNAYAPFDPDADTKLLKAVTPEQKAERENEVFEKLSWLMGRANFEEKTEEDVKKALEGTSEGGINMDVDLTVFAPGRWKIFARGDAKKTQTVRRWYKFFKKEEVTDEIWKRLVMVFKLQPHKKLGKNVDFDKLYVRVYKDIPKMDLETLIPGATPQMRLVDKANIGVPVASGVFAVLFKVVVFLLFLWGAYEFSPKDLASLPPDLVKEDTPPESKAWLYFTSGAFLLAAMGLGMYAFKSYSGYLNLKNRYEKNLSQALMYQTLDANQGVLFRLMDEAEEQECREAILGYYFLWLKAGKEGWTSEHLDDFIEDWLDKKAGIQVDFEIDDAIDKLERLNIVEKLPGGKFRAQPIEKALERLDYTWDNYFKYNNPDPKTPAAVARA